SRRDASCCSPMPRESMATSDATPTEMPIVVSEFRSTDSRKSRRASSVKSGIFILSLSFVNSHASGRRAPQLMVRKIINQLSIRQEDQALGISLSQSPFVSHHHHGHSQLLIEFANQIHNLDAGMAIEISSWFIGE